MFGKDLLQQISEIEKCASNEKKIHYKNNDTKSLLYLILKYNTPTKSV